MQPKDIGLISIAIPTRNRGRIICESINRCLAQNYPAVEVVVADNSDNSETLSAINDLHDNRIKYVRTGNLSMADNWQAALERCSGDYLYIIADKILLHEHALAILSRGIAQFGFHAYSFLHAVKQRVDSANENTWTAYPTSRLTENARKGDISSYQEFGFRGYTLAISRALFNKVVDKHGKISWPVSPDFTMAFLCSHYCDSFGYNSWCPFEYNYNYASNGFSSMFGGRLAKDFLDQYGMTEQEAVEYAPIKIYTVWNSVRSDFFRVRKMLDLETQEARIDIASCWKALYAEIMRHYMLTHVDMSEKIKVMFEMIAQKPELQNEDIMDFIDSYAIVPERQRANISDNEKTSMINRIVGKAKRLFG